ncbi:MAG: hypothetical protein CVV27_12365 [Candidatus Melainabacteria bacterium HGW-Melainabacteria-1]|nr:MAG: hypothetical protein CVV27_12365 [Candidatus Melainabacteria bacterium HGW-Melainabacteria-1]
MNQLGSGFPRLRPISELLAAKGRPPALTVPVLAQTLSSPAGSLSSVSDALASQPLPTSSAQTDLAFVQTPLIGPDDRVLHIGDSHTVGIYGKEMDKLLRATGAKVESYGSAGSSPRWWLTGQSTRSGFYGKDETGKTDAPADWRAPHPTPKLPNLLNRFKPNVVMISLGANLLGASPASIDKQVRELAEIAKASGAKIIWVGPPDGRESKKPTSKQNALYAQLQKTASEYGAFIDSRPLTDYPAKGGDGVHYWGSEGSKIAKSWAGNVYEQIQALNP